ncbi:hypothetical protein CfE428DRAFT_6492 [Chthoniobacter flavus Ellin428]|uniref:YD repeat protein n=1 Tax=Chthoniobacter flavus Ellin428 TaxID=497964 RepID=B4DC51_9BACT|nr:hypothetical protein [Chthoniobacter flavus]EDY15973.1 hypothetical protein CfE428DRAFT_6492 [Chthoniobacter flavus Ellin428]TCO83287.1 hypothetical protein EV701_1427 [Chthoniobacter flavus]
MSTRRWLLLPVLALVCHLSLALAPVTSFAAAPSDVTANDSTTAPLSNIREIHRKQHADPGPGERCYYWDQQNQLLILGQVGGDGQFIAAKPREVIDLKTHGWPISQHYPLYQDSHYTIPDSEVTAEMLGGHTPTLREMNMTPPPADWKHTFNDSRMGSLQELFYDPKTDTFRGKQLGWPKGSPVPGRKYYKLEEDSLILGTVNDSGTFVPDEPQAPIDVKTKMGVKLPYPILPGFEHWKLSYTDKEGHKIEQSYDAKTGAFQTYRK